MVTPCRGCSSSSGLRLLGTNDGPRYRAAFELPLCLTEFRGGDGELPLCRHFGLVMLTSCRHDAAVVTQCLRSSREGVPAASGQEVEGHLLTPPGRLRQAFDG